ncbi:MAG: hypothetical protein IJC04_08785 [Oscillospiraceae bacterium]|nr:hypothetical protein [Oscillospiraceae bacterium]
MEKFRKQIKRRMTTYVVLAIFLAALFTVLIILDMNNAWSMVLPAELTGGDESFDFLAGFRMGFCSSIIGFAVVRAIIFARTLKDEKKLKAMYIKETDERNLMIEQKTSSASFAVTIMGLAVACVIVSFFSRPILYTLVCVILFVSIVKVTFSIYFSRKY